MGKFFKSQEIAPEQLEVLQQQASSNPAISARVQALRDAAKAKSIASGRSVGWTDLPGQIKSIYQENGIEIPDGYDVDMDGNIVFTNKTPFLQQATWAAAPFVAGQGISSLVNGITGAVGSGTALGANAGTSSTATTAGAKAGGGGFFSKFLGGAKKLLGGRGGDIIGGILDAAGTGIGRATQASATNRGVNIDAELEAQKLRQEQARDYQDALLKRSVDDRDSLTDAFTKSVQANRVLTDTGYKPAMLSQMPGQAATALPSFGTALPAPNAQQRGDAQALYDQIQKRLTGGSQLPPLAEPVPFQNNPALLKPGAGERIGNWLAPAMKVGGAIFDPRRNDRRRPYNESGRPAAPDYSESE